MCYQANGFKCGRRPDPLTLEARLRIDTEDEIGTVVRTAYVTFHYDQANPFGIDFMFTTPDIGSGRWLLGREQLIEGLLKGSRTTTFSVRQIAVISAEGEAEPALMRLTLNGLRAKAVFEMEACSVRQWLAGTLSAVEAGTEGLRLDWDGFLAGLTNERY